jgi:hypothetical protein
VQVSVHSFRVVHRTYFHQSCSFYRAEWHQVYRQIYSADKVAQLEGFERLVVWKVRCVVLLYVKDEL